MAAGLASFREDIQVAGLIANNCSTERHRELIEESLPSSLPLWANIPKADHIALPERHLGLVQAEEISDELEQHFEAGADLLENTGLAEAIEQLAPVKFYPAQHRFQKLVFHVNLIHCPDAESL